MDPLSKPAKEPINSQSVAPTKAPAKELTPEELQAVVGGCANGKHFTT